MSLHDQEHVEIRGGCMALPLPVSTTFDLAKAVCNHGFFMMAPNEWIPSIKALRRPLHLANPTKSILVSTTQRSSHSLTILIHNAQKSHITHADVDAIKKQVTRMLRISEKDEKDVIEFQQMHKEAKEKGFGRLFRSPSVFEDPVKTILLHNILWHRSLEMAEPLCNLQQQLNANCSKSKSNKIGRNSSGKGKEIESGMVFFEANKRPKHESLGYVKKDMYYSLMPGNFPSSRELACLSTDDLKSYKLGYRADEIINLAIMVENGTLMMCIGFYNRVPIDSETLRHLKEVHDVDVNSKRRIQEGIERLYAKYSPYQCLAYWFDILQYYESRFRRLSDMPRSEYRIVSGSFKAKAVKFEGND